MAILLVPIIWLIDQYTKKKAKKELRGQERQYFLKNKVSLSFLKNEGAFMGLLKDKPKVLKGFTIASLIVILILGIPYWFLGKGKLTGTGLALMLGGAIGNYTDRVKDGYVTDFVAFAPNHKVHFNIADFAIFQGGFFILLGEIFGQ